MTRQIALYALAALFAASAAPAQRIDFPRQTFDRSRFGQPPSAAPAAAPARPSPLPSAARPAVSPAPSAAAAPAAGTPAAATAPGRTPAELVDAPRWDLVPHKTFDNPKDYERVLDLQRQTGACLLVYFHNENDSSEKGLCGWFEKHLLATRDFQKATRPYLKLSIALPGNAAAQALAKRYGVSKTPAVYVHKPNDSRPARIAVFEWPGGSPKLLPFETVLESLLKASTEACRQHVPTLL